MDEKLIELEQLLNSEGFALDIERYPDGEKLVIRKFLVTIHFDRVAADKTSNKILMQVVEREYAKLR